MSPQQTVMLESLQRRNITKVIVKPDSPFEMQCADATLTKNQEVIVKKHASPYGEYSATVAQLRKYYEAQSVRSA